MQPDTREYKIAQALYTPGQRETAKKHIVNLEQNSVEHNGMKSFRVIDEYTIRATIEPTIMSLDELDQYVIACLRSLKSKRIKGIFPFWKGGAIKIRYIESDKETVLEM